tara:strand:- start:138816 stop:139853 length:1038 start_codon:yes stop_codon:yes gene_type:complete
MKKNLLLAASLIFGATSFAQFTQTNEPTIGDGTTLYVIDSMAPNFDAETGAGASWDYSTYGGYDNDSRVLTVLDPTSTANASDFPTSTATLDIQNFLKTYTTSSATERVSQGFVYTDADLGDIVVVLDTDDALQYQYPFALSDNFTDAFEGTATFDIGGGPQTAPAAGELTASVDGTGTLTLADGVSYSDVTRYKLIDSTTVNVQLLGEFTLLRTQYEYYDLANSSLPVFVHTTVSFGQGGAPISEFSLVLSAEDPAYVLDVEENNILESTRLYPNPASSEINVVLPNNVEDAQITIVDAVGRQVYSGTINSMNQQVDVSSLNEGMYFVQLTNGQLKTTKSVVIK